MIEGYIRDVNPAWCKVTHALDGSRLSDIRSNSYRSSRKVVSTSHSSEDLNEDEDEDTDEAIAEESEKRILAREASGKKPSSEKQPTGRIVGIIKRNWRA